MGRGKRKQGSVPAGIFAVRSEAAGEAVRELLDRVDLALEPDVDLDELTREIEEGLDLIASYHPEARSAETRRAVYTHVKGLLAEMGVGLSSEPEAL